MHLPTNMKTNNAMLILCLAVALQIYHVTGMENLANILKSVEKEVAYAFSQAYANLNNITQATPESSSQMPVASADAVGNPVSNVTAAQTTKCENINPLFRIDPQTSSIVIYCNHSSIPVPTPVVSAVPSIPVPEPVVPAVPITPVVNATAESPVKSTSMITIVNATSEQPLNSATVSLVNLTNVTLSTNITSTSADPVKTPPPAPSLALVASAPAPAHVPVETITASNIKQNQTTASTSLSNFIFRAFSDPESDAHSKIMSIQSSLYSTALVFAVAIAIIT